MMSSYTNREKQLLFSAGTEKQGENESCYNNRRANNEKEVFFMIVTNKGQQQSVKFVVDTDRCCGCRRCIRRCMEDVWQWDEENHYAYPKYPDECVLCLQCEMDCLNNVIDIYPLNALQIDPLEYSANLSRQKSEEGGN